MWCLNRDNRSKLCDRAVGKCKRRSKDLVGREVSCKGVDVRGDGNRSCRMRAGRVIA